MSGVGASTGTSTEVSAQPRSARRFTGLLPHRLLRWRRPLWWQEIGIIALGYWLYSLGRNAVPKQASIAERHGRDIQSLQDWMHLNWELSINRWFAAHEWAATIINYYYSTLHFIVTPAVLIWLFLKRSHLYRGIRTVLFVTSIVGLVGFYLYPVAPPRLLAGFGYVDTVVKFHTWGSFADPSIAQHSNQFAAMPSLHTAWAVWCGVVLWVCARRMWVRILGILYPMATITVIMGTANHFILDAVGGIIVLAIGFGIQALLSGHGAFVAPFDAPDVGMPDQPLPHLSRQP